MSAAPCYSPRLDQALAQAANDFRGVRRKGTDIPYLTHLLAVMVSVGEHGGDEDQLIAAVLHDWLEDVPGATVGALEADYGPRVARLVLGLSDSTGHPKPPWEQRKLDYLAHLALAPAELKLISAADKLHNARSIHRDLRQVGEAVWARFSAPRGKTLWYYRALLPALGEGWRSPLLDELGDEVRALHETAGVAPG